MGEYANDAATSSADSVPSSVRQKMVDAFLRWKLPADFRPDGGISFKAEFNEHTAHPMRHEPTGTNLLDARQAGEMVDHLLASTGEAPEVTELRADARCMANLIEKLRHTVCMIRDEMQDEGGRVYFGSTNQADQLKDVADAMESLAFDRIVRGKKQPDLYADLRGLRLDQQMLQDRIKELIAESNTIHEEREALRGERDDLLAALREFFTSADFDLIVTPQTNGTPQADKSANAWMEKARAAIAKATGAA